MKRLVLIALVAATVAAATLTTPTTHASSRYACGVERWPVKTLQDRPRLLRPRKTTIHFLITRPAPQTLPDTRLPFEHRVYTVIAAVVLIRPEEDSDLHVVLQHGGNHMITKARSGSRGRETNRSTSACRRLRR